MYSKFWGTVVPARVRAFTSRGASIVLASTGIWLMTGATVYAEDTATLQRLEAHIQQLEERHQSERGRISAAPVGWRQDYLEGRDRADAVLP